MVLKILNIITLCPVIRIIVEIPKILAIRLDPIGESCCHAIIFAYSAHVREQIILLNVRCQVSPPASGTQACTAGDVPEVPKAWGLAARPCSAILFCSSE